MRQRFATLTAAAFTLALLVPVASVSAASAIHVHPGQSIQAAINGAPAGSVIYVARGTYRGNLEVARSVRLIGDHAVIVPAESPRDNSLSGLPAWGPGHLRSWDVQPNGSIQAPISNVSIEGFTVRNFSGPGIVAIGVDVFPCRPRRDGAQRLLGHGRQRVEGRPLLITPPTTVRLSDSPPGRPDRSLRLTAGVLAVDLSVARVADHRRAGRAGSDRIGA